MTVNGTPDRVVEDLSGGGGGGGSTTIASPLPLPTTIQTPNADSAMDEANDAVRVNVVAGGAGGGAVTVADGADVNAGSTTDIAETSDSDGTLSGKLRGLVKWAYERMPSSLGQKLMAASFPVTLASDQSAVPVTGTVTVNEPVSVDDNGGSLTVDGPLTDAELRATAVPVSGTVSVNEPVSVDDNGGSLTVDGSVSLAASIPAGTNNIGDVDVLSVIPGTGATNLGKAEGTAHVSGDVGVMALGVANSLLTSFSSQGQYSLLATTDEGAVISAGTNPAGIAKISRVNTNGVPLAETVSGEVATELGVGATVKVAHLDMTTATTSDIVAAVVGKKIRVLEYTIICNEDATSNVNFARTGTTRVTGSPIYLMRMSGSGQPNATRVAPTGGFLFETPSGEPLRVTSSAAVDISVAVVYIEV